MVRDETSAASAAHRRRRNKATGRYMTLRSTRTRRRPLRCGVKEKYPGREGERERRMLRAETGTEPIMSSSVSQSDNQAVVMHDAT